MNFVSADVTKRTEGTSRRIRSGFDFRNMEFKCWDLLDFATSYADGRLTFTFKNGSTFEG